jgi:hypothetical protein
VGIADRCTTQRSTHNDRVQTATGSAISRTTWLVWIDLNSMRSWAMCRQRLSILDRLLHTAAQQSVRMLAVLRVF